MHIALPVINSTVSCSAACFLVPGHLSLHQAMVESLLKEYPNVLTLRVRMPIVADLVYPRNFITKIIKYDKVRAAGQRWRCAEKAAHGALLPYNWCCQSDGAGGWFVVYAAAACKMVTLAFAGRVGYLQSSQRLCKLCVPGCCCRTCRWWTSPTP
jgi:hypothetical protein